MDEVLRARLSLDRIAASVRRLESAERATGSPCPRWVLECVMECASNEMAIIESNALVDRVPLVHLWK
jgi:hypothetical protein